MTNLGRKIELYTIQNNITIKEFARSLGVTTECIYLWSGNRSNCKPYKPSQEHAEMIQSVTNSYITVKDCFE
jgi:DNA-binding transcriptional regulator YiaG